MVSTAPAPTFSVVVATYNRCEVLEFALRSVLAQHFTDFEVLVVGDACTDDSEALVSRFGDARLHWHNLANNVGSQWGPNNQGLAMARGHYIAYLGHDDLWWPTHLGSVLACFQASKADVVAAGCLMYGPAGSGVRALSGFFPNGRFSPRHFFPPSSMAHRRELAVRIGGWRGPEAARIAVDADFLLRAHEAGAQVAGTRDVTCFKFNAAWRRDAYRHREAGEQRGFWQRMAEEGEAFRLHALTEALVAAHEDRIVRVEIDPGSDQPATQSAALNHAFKGTARTRALPAPELLAEGGRRYPVTGVPGGFEWHAVESHPELGAFRWSGPSPQATVLLPERGDHPLEVDVLIVGWIDDAVLEGVGLNANVVVLATRLREHAQGAKLLQARIEPPGSGPRDELALTLTVPRTWRPLDLGLNEDRRWLGLGIGWIEVRDAPTCWAGCRCGPCAGAVPQPTG